MPGGNLANSSALSKGFAELRKLGFISRVPRISIIQAEGASPLYRSVQEWGGAKLEAVTAETRASAIRIGNPASWRKAVQTLLSTGGWCEQVSEREIAIAKARIGAEGIGCEPASAVTLAGLEKLVARGHVGRDETAVLVLTGHTLKDPEYTIDFHRGELFTAEEEASASPTERRATASLQREPWVLDASVDQVLSTLDRINGFASQPA